MGASRFWGRPPGPEDYDQIGFTEALDRFDIAGLRPHFPGYPVYVAAGKLAHLALPAFDAAAAVSALAAAATALAVFALGRARSGARAAWLALGLYAVAALPWLSGGVALSDGLACAFAAWAAWAALAARPSLAGLCVGLMLGTRASYFPLALSLGALVLAGGRLTRGARARGLAVLVLACLAWAVPLGVLVGPRAYLALGRTHLAGHFTRWGHTAVTHPGLGARLFAFARALAWDGLAPSLLPSLVLLALIGAGLFLELRHPEPADPPASRAEPAETLSRARPLRVLAWLVLPYGLWALLGQNVLEQPRHLLPLTLALIVLAGVALARLPLALGFAALAVTAPVSVGLVRERQAQPPPAVQAARFVKGRFPSELAAGQVALFGARAARFFAREGLPAWPRLWLSEVDVTVERLNVLPRWLLVTDELEPDTRRAARLEPLATFCRDRRLDRAAPCLTLSRYRLGLAP